MKVKGIDFETWYAARPEWITQRPQTLAVRAFASRLLERSNIPTPVRRKCGSTAASIRTPPTDRRSVSALERQSVARLHRRRGPRSSRRKWINKAQNQCHLDRRGRRRRQLAAELLQHQPEDRLAGGNGFRRHARLKWRRSSQPVRPRSDDRPELQLAYRSQFVSNNYDAYEPRSYDLSVNFRW